MRDRTIRAVTTAAFAMAIPAAAHAALLTTIEGDNDCPGYFGGTAGEGGFSACVASRDNPDPDGADLDGTPSIIQFIFNEETDAFSVSNISTAFPTITGDEFTFDYAFGGGTGTWFYVPGPGDPLITAYTANAGNGFNLFSAEDGLTGMWMTPLNNQGGPRGLSHLTFFDTAVDGGEDGGTIPEPRSLLLLGLALVGAASGLRRRRIGR